MMSGHTKGPWAVVPWYEDQKNAYLRAGRTILAGVRLIDEEQRANARLMAAAPEIIESLKGMLSVAITGRNFTGEVGQALIKQASAAIAKAEGRV